MSTEFPHKSFPCSKVDPDSLARHTNAADPHPGAYIRAVGNTLGLEHVTLFHNVEEFRRIPENKSIGYDPGLVIFIGTNATDSITGISYVKYHPYVYQGTNKTVSGVTYPIWTDKVDEWGGNRAEAIAKDLIYKHATDSDTTLENVHPTLARKVHTHVYSDIIDFATKVFDASQSLYTYIVKDVDTANKRKFRDAVILYIGDQAEYTPGHYFQKGHLYHYEYDNVIWTDITTGGGSSGESYTKDEINLFMTKHNANQHPWSHEGFSQVGHMHDADDINNFSANVKSIADASVATAMDEHNASTSVHTTLINGHNTNPNAHAGLFADKTATEAHIANSDIHVTLADKTKWNNLSGIPGFNCVTGKNSMPVFEYSESIVLGGENTYKLQMYPSALNDETTIMIETANASYTDLAGIYLQEDYTKTGTSRTYLKRGSTTIRLSYNGSAWTITGGSAEVAPTLAQEKPASTSLWMAGSTAIQFYSYFGYTDEENKGLLEYKAGDTIYLNLTRELPPTAIKITFLPFTYSYNESGNTTYEGVFYYCWSHPDEGRYYTTDRSPDVNDFVYNINFVSANNVESVIKSGIETLATAVIKSIDLENCIIYLTDTLYQDPVTSTTTIGLDKANYSYRVTTSTAEPSKQYLIWSGAATDRSLFDGKKIYIKYSTNKPEANTIAKIVAGATSSADRVYLSTAVTGLTGNATVTAYYGTPSTFIAQNDTINPNYCLAQGESQFAAGYCSTVLGGWNTVTGMCSVISGSMNVVSGTFDVVGGTGNIVTGSSTLVLGTANKAADTFDIAIGDQNKLWYQSQIAIGSMNEMTGINTMAVGNNNNLTQWGSLAVGDLNTVEGKYSFSFGYSNKIYSSSTYVFGRYADVKDLPKYKNAFVVWGGERDSNARSFSIHSHKASYNAEFDVNTLTSDTKFIAGTQYYIRGTTSAPYQYVAVSMITNGATIPAGTYYTKSGSTYTEASGTFQSSKTYYTKYTIDTVTNYTEAIRAGATVTANKYYITNANREVDDHGNKKYIPVIGYRTEYKGQLSPDTDAPVVLTTAMEYEIDFEKFSRIKLPANVAVTLSAKKDDTRELDVNGLGKHYIDGDKCELIIPASTVVTFPSEWHMGSFTYQTGKFYILELEVIDDVIYLRCKYSE